MDQKTEFMNLIQQLMETKESEAFQNVVAKNIKSITPVFLEFVDDMLEATESESGERSRRTGEVLRALRESIDMALARLRRRAKPSPKQESRDEKSRIDWKTIPVPFPKRINEYYDSALKKCGFTDPPISMGELYHTCEQAFVNSFRARLIDELTSEEMNEYRKLIRQSNSWSTLIST